MVDSGLIANIVENRRRDQAAGVAVDAGRVDEEIAWCVFGDPES
jgi:hypothetical protein